jgi:hypothetical protein
MEAKKEREAIDAAFQKEDSAMTVSDRMTHSAGKRYVFMPPPAE